MSGYRALAANRQLRHSESFYHALGVDRYVGMVKRAAPAATGAVLGVMASSAHPVLGAIFGSALVKGAVDVAGGETVSQAAKGVGRSAVAVAGSLALPASPVLGYGAGVLIGNAIFGAEAAPTIDDVRAGKALIKRGMKGPAVVRLQYLLGMTGDDLNGIYGPRTLARVKAFQESVGLRFEDGDVGANTIHELETALTKDAGNRVPQIEVTPVQSAAKSTPRSSASSSAQSTSAALVPVASSGGSSFLSKLRQPITEGSSVTIGQGVLLGVGGGIALGVLGYALTRSAAVAVG